MPNDSSCKYCPLKPVCNKGYCFENTLFKLAGVTPHEKEHREHLDYLYLSLWISSIGYQVLLLIAFFYDYWQLAQFLEYMEEPYIVAVAGYGVVKLFYIDTKDKNIRLERRSRKKRTGHRFIFYWWLNFFIMTAGVFLLDRCPDNILDPPISTSLKIATMCTVIGIGYIYGKTNGKIRIPI